MLTNFVKGYEPKSLIRNASSTLLCIIIVRIFSNNSKE